MGLHRTAFGETYRVERRLPRIAWRPRWRGPENAGNLLQLADIGGGEGPLAILSLIVLVVIVVLVCVPLLLLVLEVALVLALIVPLMVLALTVGGVRHTVLVRRGEGEHAPVVARREVRGVIASWRAARELRAQADAGALREAAPLER